jgi:hypothetical protein
VENQAVPPKPGATAAKPKPAIAAAKPKSESLDVDLADAFQRGAGILQ